MKKFFLSVLMVPAISTVSSAQQRLVLLEHFTQASCGPCASQNPALNSLLDQNLDKIVAIKYQTSWPGVDPMNAANPTDVQGRVTYYNVSGVPNSVMDGNVYNGSPGGVTQTAINNRHNVGPGVDTKVSYVIISNPAAASDSMLITARVKAVNAITAGKVLHVVAIEREIEFATAPGSNGEKKFESVMKKMFPSSSGTTLPAMAAGDSLSFTFKMSLKRPNGSPVYYNLGQAAAVAFVQNNSTKEVLGAGYDEPRPWLSVTKPEGQKSVRIKGGNEILFGIKLTSKSDVDQTIKVKGIASSLPMGWTAKIVVDGIEYSDSSSVALAANMNKDVQLKVTGPNDGMLNKKVSFKVEANSETLYPTVKSALEFTAVTPSNILLLDLAGTATARFNQVFTLLQEPACFLNAVESADLDSSGLNAANVKKLFYTTGAAYAGTLGAYRSEAFMKYLNSGGRMLVMGQDIGYDLGQVSDPASEAFFADYLGAEYLTDGDGTTITVSGNQEDGLMAPFFPTNLTLSGTGSYPDHLAVAGAAPNAKAFLDYSDSDFAGIYNFGENWKTVFLGFRMEAFSTNAAGTNLRNTIFGRINGWFDANPSLTAAVTGPSTVCQGSNITLTADSASSYLWNTGASTQSITVTAAGKYIVQVREADGTAVSNIITVDVVPSPTITTQPANQTAVYGASATFSCASSTTGATWQWQKNNGTTFENITDGGQFSGATTSTLVISNVSAADNGTTYRCVVSNQEGCSKNTTAAALTTNAASSVSGQIEVSVKAYPNPASTRLVVPVPASAKTIRISDLSGKEMFRMDVSKDKAEEVLDVKMLSSGIYQLSLEAPGFAPAVQKLVIR